MAVSNRVRRKELRREVVRRHNEINRRKRQAQFKARRQAGLVRVALWLDKRRLLQARERAYANGVAMCVLVQAAVEVGLRTLRPSELIHYERMWRQIVPLPAIPRRPNMPYDASAQFQPGHLKRLSVKAMADRKARFGLAFIKYKAKRYRKKENVV